MKPFPFALVAFLAALSVLAAACGIPEDSSPRALAAATPTPTVEEPTPTPVVTQEFTIYLTDGQGKVRPARRQLPSRLTVSALIDELKEVPTEEESEAGLVSLIPLETTLIDEPVTDSAGLTILNFAAGSFDSLQGETLILALAQLVWTLTESPTVRSVLIRIENEGERWPTDDGDFTVLRRSNYDTFDPSFVAPTPEPSPDVPVEEEPTPEPLVTPEPTPTATATAEPGGTEDGG